MASHSSPPCHEHTNRHTQKAESDLGLQCPGTPLFCPLEHCLFLREHSFLSQFDLGFASAIIPSQGFFTGTLDPSSACNQRGNGLHRLCTSPQHAGHLLVLNPCAATAALPGTVDKSSLPKAPFGFLGYGLTRGHR